MKRSCSSRCDLHGVADLPETSSEAVDGFLILSVGTIVVGGAGAVGN